MNAVSAMPVAIARESVRRWFDSLLTTKDPYQHVRLDHDFTAENAFAHVESALEEDYRAQYGDENLDAMREDFAREAGYLIGVQVGLRLRNGDA
jgi:hypothetical protein